MKTQLHDDPETMHLEEWEHGNPMSGLVLRMFLLMVLVVLFGLALVMLFGIFRPVSAHMAESGWVYPDACCGEEDCRKVFEGEVVPAGGRPFLTTRTGQPRPPCCAIQISQ